MILCDRRKGSAELLSMIRSIGVQAELTELAYADFAFEGNGPSGRIAVGVERKALHDMLNCIDDHRYIDTQRKGMARMYGAGYSVLMLEGEWRARDGDGSGLLMEGHKDRDGRTVWSVCKPSGRPVMYSKLYRYLFSINLSNVMITYSRDMWQTAYNVCELYHYFQKRWADHTSILETQRLALPTMLTAPSLTLKWATDIDGVGVKTGADAERLFKLPTNLSNSTEEDWCRIPGIAAKTAGHIMRQIRTGRVK